MKPIGFELYSPFGMEETIEKITELLQQNGFGILTRIDIHEKIFQKTGNQMEPYVVLGACNPGFSHQLLKQDLRVGVFLPCNVTVFQENGKTRMIIQDPGYIGESFEKPEMREIAGKVREILAGVTEEWNQKYKG